MTVTSDDLRNIAGDLDGVSDQLAALAREAAGSPNAVDAIRSAQYAVDDAVRIAEAEADELDGADDEADDE